MSNPYALCLKPKTLCASIHSHEFGSFIQMEMALDGGWRNILMSAARFTSKLNNSWERRHSHCRYTAGALKNRSWIFDFLFRHFLSLAFSFESDKRQRFGVQDGFLYLCSVLQNNGQSDTRFLFILPNDDISYCDCATCDRDERNMHGYLWNDADRGQQKYSDKMTSQCHLVRRFVHVTTEKYLTKDEYFLFDC
jgi:hypothetical protein